MINESELVTVWIATYRNFRYINQSLKSILTQNYPKIELFICDDGSPNFPYEEIYNFIEENKKENLIQVKILTSDKNYGTVRNINRVIDIAKGEYFIAFSPDDTLYDESTITDVVNEFKKTKCDIMTSYRLCCDEEFLRPIEKFPLKNEVRKIKKMDPLKLAKELCINGNFISGAGTFYRRDFFDKYGKFDENYILLEDYPTYLKILKLGCKIHFFDKITYKHRVGGISTGKTPHPTLIKDTQALLYNEVQNNSNNYSKFEIKIVRFMVYKCDWSNYSKVKKVLFLIKYIDVLLIKKVPNKIRKLYTQKKLVIFSLLGRKF